MVTFKNKLSKEKDKGFVLSVDEQQEDALSMTIHKSPLSMRSFLTDYLPVELIYKSKMLPTETAHTALN